MERNSLLDIVLKNVAVLMGFVMAAVLMILGIIDHKKVLKDAANPQRHAAATFFVIVLVIYFLTFMVFAAIQCIDGFKLAFSSHKISPDTPQVIDP